MNALSVEEIQKKRNARKIAVAEARAEQFAIDLQRLDELEERHGFERVLRIDLDGWDPAIGGPTMVVCRVPKGSEAVMKAYESETAKAGESGEKKLRAANVLGRACLIYPDPGADKDLFATVLETAPGIVTHAAMLVIRRAQGVAAEEGKD